MDAIEAKDLARVKTLLQAGADPNERTLFGAPLNLAASNGSVEIAVSCTANRHGATT
jgi:ankyrin repeat protein